MKATGEYMGIGLTFEESLLKCISKQEILKKLEELQHFSIKNLLEKVKIPTDQRLFQIIELLNRYVSIQEISDITFINVWFLVRLKNILDFDITKKPYFRAIDGSAGEFDSKTNYIYSTKEVNEHEILPLSEENSKGKIIILGSSAIKIGQGIEFDYASVHAVKSLKKPDKALLELSSPQKKASDPALHAWLSASAGSGKTQVLTSRVFRLLYPLCFCLCLYPCLCL